MSAGGKMSLKAPLMDFTAPLINLNGIAMVNSPGIVPIKCEGIFSEQQQRDCDQAMPNVEPFLLQQVVQSQSLVVVQLQ